MPNHCFGLREVCAVLAWSDARNAAAFAGYESEAMSDPCATVPPMQSEQTRQWKREQRRRKREERRQGLRSAIPLDAGPLPPTEISDVLLDYVRPLIERLSLATRVEQLTTLLRLAAVVWNGMVERWDRPEDSARKIIANMQLEFHTPPPLAVIDWLARRRIFRYGNDPRRIGSVEVVREGDRIRAVATSPTV